MGQPITDSEEMKIRKLKPEDWQELKALMVNSCKESPNAFTEIPNENMPDSDWKGRARIWSQGTEVTFILYNNHGVWGILKGSTGNIGHFWVAPEFRGDKEKRYGQQLLNKFLDWAREHQASNICLYVEESSKAIGFYELAGFKATGDTSENMIEMKLEI